MPVGWLPFLQDPLCVRDPRRILLEAEENLFRGGRAVNTTSTSAVRPQYGGAHGAALWLDAQRRTEMDVVQAGDVIAMNVAQKRGQWRAPLAIVAEIIDCFQREQRGASDMAKGSFILVMSGNSWTTPLKVDISGGNIDPCFSDKVCGARSGWGDEGVPGAGASSQQAVLHSSDPADLMTCSTYLYWHEEELHGPSPSPLTRLSQWNLPRPNRIATAKASRVGGEVSTFIPTSRRGHDEHALPVSRSDQIPEAELDPKNLLHVH